MDKIHLIGNVLPYYWGFVDRTRRRVLAIALIPVAGVALTLAF